MRLLRRLACVLLVAGCSPSVSGSDDDDDVASATPTPAPGIHITTDTTWSGAYAVTDDTYVDAGVTLTISSGSTITVTTGKQLAVDGHLEVLGLVTSTAFTPTRFEPTVGTWSGITVRSGGTATIRNIDVRGAQFGVRTDAGAGATKVISAKMTNVTSPVLFSGGGKACRLRLDGTDGPVSILGGDVTIADSDLREGNGDRVTFSGSGSLTMLHIIVGGTAEHCLIHGSTSSFTLTKSIFLNGEYAFMIGSTASSQVHHNQILMGNMGAGLDAHSGGTVDATENFWGGTAYPGTPPSGWNVSNPVPSLGDARVADAGPRPWGSGCEVDSSF